MGWECTAKAGCVLDAIEELLSVKGKSANEINLDGEAIGFWEIGKDRPDGAIVGKVWRFTGEKTPEGKRLCHSMRGFRIDPGGKISRFPLIPTEIKRLAEKRGLEIFQEKFVSRFKLEKE